MVIMLPNRKLSTKTLETICTYLYSLLLLTTEGSTGYGWLLFGAAESPKVSGRGDWLRRIVSSIRTFAWATFPGILPVICTSRSREPGATVNVRKERILKHYFQASQKHKNNFKNSVSQTDFRVTQLGIKKG